MQIIFFFFLFQKVYLRLCWVFVAALVLSPAAESGGYCLAVVHSPRAHGFQQSRSLGSVAVAHQLSCTAIGGSSQIRDRTRVFCIDRRIKRHTVILSYWEGNFSYF